MSEGQRLVGDGWSGTQGRSRRLPISPLADVRILQIWESFHGALTTSQRLKFLERSEVANLRWFPEPLISCAFSELVKLPMALVAVRSSAWWFSHEPCAPHEEHYCRECRPIGRLSARAIGVPVEDALADLDSYICDRASEVSRQAESRVITAALGEIVTRWGIDRGATIQREAAVVVDGSTRRGRLDFLLWWEDAALAVEIDRGNKKWSLQKLQHVALGIGGLATGSLWLRWKGVPIEVPGGVHLARPVLG